MKSICALLSLVSLAISSPVLQFSGDSEQQVLGYPTEYPGFDLDLNELRLVELEGQAPVWMSELEKVRLSVGWATKKHVSNTALDPSQDQGDKLPRYVRAFPYFSPNELTPRIVLIHQNWAWSQNS